MFLDWGSCLSNGVATLRCAPVVFNNVANALLLFSGIVALFLIAWSSIRLIMSGGDPKQVGAYRQMLNYAIIGLIVVLISIPLVFFIGYLTKTTNCITDLAKIATGGCN